MKPLALKHFDVFSNLILAWFFLAIGMLFNSILWSSLGYAWALHNAQLLREGKFSEINIEHIIEELESMGKSDKREYQLT
jgi:biopolymer transport protein ExbB/TolQ